MAALRAVGLSVTSVGEIAPGAPDDAVLRLSAEGGRIVVTEDKDFGELVFRRHGATVGVVLIRMPEASAGAVAARLIEFFNDRDLDPVDAFTVLEADRTRTRRLPRG